MNILTGDPPSMHEHWNPVKRFGGKSSEEYKYFANDFQSHRLVQLTSIYLQCAPIAQREDVRSVLEFGSGRNLTKFISEYLGISHTSVDISDRFRPAHVSSILDFPVHRTEIRSRVLVPVP